MERSADWMDQAQGDLAHAKDDVERRFYDWACFSAQQAAVAPHLTVVESPLGFECQKGLGRPSASFGQLRGLGHFEP